MRLEDAALLLGVSIYDVRRQAYLGRLRAAKVRGRWVVDAQDIDRYRRDVQRPWPIATRFWAKVDVSGGPDACWPWRGGTSRGYGRMRVDGRLSPATHVALDLVGRPLSAGQDACHSCDNPPCVNPAHLFAGTARDNGQDMARKGRAGPQNRPPLHGEQNPNARLTPAAVTEIRAAVAAGTPLAVAGARYGIGKSAVWLVVRRKSWRHIP